MDPKNLSIGGFGGFGWVPKYGMGRKFKYVRERRVGTKVSTFFKVLAAIAEKRRWIQKF